MVMATHRIKKQVPGGWVFRAATGDWTYRLNAVAVPVAEWIARRLVAVDENLT